jgi:hypothetical protein
VRVVAHRNPEDQASHDKAVEDIAASPRYHTKWGKVITNPGSVKNQTVNGQYPDIVVVWLYVIDNVKEIGEVETSDSVNETEALSQWLEYGKLGVPFDLFVPSETYTNAHELVKKYEIKLSEIVPYSYEGGRIKFV